MFFSDTAESLGAELFRNEPGAEFSLDQVLLFLDQRQVFDEHFRCFDLMFDDLQGFSGLAIVDPDTLEERMVDQIKEQKDAQADQKELLPKRRINKFATQAHFKVLPVKQPGPGS